MAVKSIQVPEGTQLAIITDCHEHSEQFFNILDQIRPRENLWLISLGDVYGKGFGLKAAEKITDELQRLQNKGCCFAVRGNHDLKEVKKAKGTNKWSPQLKWWSQQPLALSFQFYNGARVTAVHAGVTPLMTWEDLDRSVEVCYVRDIDEDGKMIPLIWKDINGVSTLIKSKEGGDVWHKKYDGRFGYIVSGHAAQKDGEAKFYKFSCNLDSCVYETGILTAQVFAEDGSLGRIIRVQGAAKKPELNIGY